MVATGGAKHDVAATTFEVGRGRKTRYGGFEKIVP
jgi:hypothetical protein